MKVIRFSSGCHYVPRPWYQETENGYRIKPAEFYDNYIGEPIIEVSKEVFACMMTAYYETKQYYQQYDRHQPLTFDEIITGAAQHILSPSAETICFEHLDSEAMLALMSHLDPKISRLVYLRFVAEMTLTEIAESEGMSVPTTWRMIRKGLADLKEIIVNSDNEPLDCD